MSLIVGIVSGLCVAAVVQVTSGWPQQGLGAYLWGGGMVLLGMLGAVVYEGAR